MEKSNPNINLLYGLQYDRGTFPCLLASHPTPLGIFPFPLFPVLTSNALAEPTVMFSRHHAKQAVIVWCTHILPAKCRDKLIHERQKYYCAPMFRISGRTLPPHLIHYRIP